MTVNAFPCLPTVNSSRIRPRRRAVNPWPGKLLRLKGTPTATSPIFTSFQKISMASSCVEKVTSTDCGFLSPDFPSPLSPKREDPNVAATNEWFKEAAKSKAKPTPKKAPVVEAKEDPFAALSSKVEARY